MNRILLPLLLGACIAFALACCATVEWRWSDRYGTDGITVVAEFYDLVDAETWAGIEPVSVVTEGGRRGATQVELRAAHDPENLYIQLRWMDPTLSDTKKAWVYEEATWKRKRGDEDRIGIAFNISSKAFAKEGCAALCHEGNLHAGEPNEQVDLWQWKAARGGQHGWCDDQRIGSERPKGRKEDEGESCYKKNESEDKLAPALRWADDADREGAFDSAASRGITQDWKPTEGYTVPAYMLRTPKGSRADVGCVADYDNGVWTVTLHRKLVTGNPDDAVFKPGGRSTFAIALFDNTGATTGDEHSISGPVTLWLKR